MERTQHTLHSWKGIYAMRTIELTTIAQPVEDLLDLADAEGYYCDYRTAKSFCSLLSRMQPQKMTISPMRSPVHAKMPP